MSFDEKGSLLNILSKNNPDFKPPTINASNIATAVAIEQQRLRQLKSQSKEEGIAKDKLKYQRNRWQRHDVTDKHTRVRGGEGTWGAGSGYGASRFWT